ncbi:hypothetical protein KZZ07_21905 [Mameliella sp. CS4]|uniref:hypothetical protein n=1 Tax=Mameliella sp. CS4 TaxID=2862329 RepID=UPI001C5EDCCB|nr:hypothetical protein [Mameliella sp. CS4]MBW4985203.1 hypothetical protein [Mameliella sp. CS4]
MSEERDTRLDVDEARVLVVDDNALNRSKMRIEVRALGHSVETAAGGAEALVALRKAPFDVDALSNCLRRAAAFQSSARQPGN